MTSHLEVLYHLREEECEIPLLLSFLHFFFQTRVDLADKADQLYKKLRDSWRRPELEAAPGHAEDAVGQMVFCLVFHFCYFLSKMGCRRWSQKVLIVL